MCLSFGLGDAILIFTGGFAVVQWEGSNHNISCFRGQEFANWARN